MQVLFVSIAIEDPVDVIRFRMEDVIRVASLKNFVGPKNDDFPIQGLQLRLKQKELE